MRAFRTALAVIFFSGIAQAQTPGIGETRPAEPAPRRRRKIRISKPGR
jgi:hypothetical protein